MNFVAVPRSVYWLILIVSTVGFNLFSQAYLPMLAEPWYVRWIASGLLFLAALYAAQAWYAPKSKVAEGAPQ